MRALIFDLILSVFVCIFFIYFYLYNIEVFLYFGILINFFILIISELFYKKIYYKLITVICFGINTRLLVILDVLFKNNIASDTSFNILLSNSIKYNGYNYFGIGFDRSSDYSYHPGLDIWSSIFNNITSININYIAIIIFPILNCILFIIFYYLAISYLINKRIALYSSIIVILCPSFPFFDSAFVQQSFSILFGVIIIYLIFLNYIKKENNIIKGIIIPLIFIMVVSHHFTTYNIILILLLIWICPYINKYINKNNDNKNIYIDTKNIILYIIITLTWIMYISIYLFIGQIDLFSYFFKSNISEYVSHSMKYLNLTQKYFVYSGYAILLIYGFYGFLNCIIYNNILKKHLIIYWFIYSSSYFIIFTYFLPNIYNFASISQRAWIFNFLGISPMIGIGISKIINSLKNSIKYIQLILILLLILPLFSTMLLAPHNILEPSSSTSKVSYIFTAAWLKKYKNNSLYAMDVETWNIIVPYGQLLYHPDSSPYNINANNFVDYVYNPSNFNQVFQKYDNLIYNKELNLLYNKSNKYNMFDEHYQRIFDTKSLLLYVK